MLTLKELNKQARYLENIRQGRMRIRALKRMTDALRAGRTSCILGKVTVNLMYSELTTAGMVIHREEKGTHLVVFSGKVTSERN